MKIFTFSFKTLLLAAGLVMSSASAWGGETTTLLEYGTASVAWTTTNLAEWTAGGSPTLADGIVTISGGSGSYATSKTISPTSNAILNLTAVWRGRSNTGRYFSNSNGSYFRFGNIVVAQNDQDKKHGYTLSGLSSMASVTTFTAGSYRVDITSSTWLLIEAEINTATNTLTSFTIKSEDGNTTYVNLSDQALSSYDYTTVAFGYQKGGGVKTTNTEQLKSVKITQTTQAVTSADYTINYKLDDEVVKTVAASSVVGAEITAETAIDGEGTYAGNHYLITAATAPSMILVADEASNVLNVPVRAPYTATLTVTTTIGGDAQTPVVTNLKETDEKVCSWSYAYPLYVMYNGVYYKADVTSTFGEGGTFTNGEAIEKSVTYTNADESVVYFSEAEASAGTTYTYSNGGTAYVAAQNKRDRGISVGTLAAGTYGFEAKIVAANKRSLVIRQSTNDPLASVGTSTDDMTTGVKTALFTLDAETSGLYINGANSGTEKTNQSEDFDYVLIRNSIPVTITSAGWATLYTPYALDFSEVSGLTAYTATYNEGSVELTKVDNVPANTGVVLKGAEGDYNIPLAASSVTAQGDLTGDATEATPCPAASGTYYILAMNDESKAQFFPATEGSIEAGKAYLPVASPAGILNIVFDGEATGIAAPEVAAKEDGVIYNVNGQVVTSDYKGVVIKNGKKYFNK